MIKREKVRFGTKRFFSRVIFFAGIAVLIILCSALFKEYYRGYQIQKEINSLQKDIDSFKKDNYQLSQLIEYYNTDEYKEAELRKRFNMKKGEEKLVVIESKDDNLMGDSVGEKDETVDENLPNYKKWWNYFFATK